jgi:hypothetical protein
MSFDAGSAVGKYVLDISDATAKANQLKTIFAGIATAQAKASGSGGNSGSAAAADQQKAERAILARASAEARLAQVQNTGKNALAGLTQAEQIYQQALAKVDQTSTAAIRTQSQLAAVQNRLANVSGGGLQVLPRSLENFGPQALQQIQSGLLGVVGPAALVTAGFAAVGKAIDLTEESFKLKASLDQTNLSISLQLKNFRDVNTTLRDGAQFASRYAITQQDNAEAIRASIPLLRQSKASLSDVEAVLLRLSVLKPEQGIQGAAFALAELQGGQSKSLNTRFDVPIAKANELRDAIRNGGDAVSIVDTYLTSVGVGMDALSVRTQGAAGKMNELAVETEKFKLALGGAAGGPGLAILEARINLTKDATKLLSGDLTQVNSLLGDSFGKVNPLIGVMTSYNTAVLNAGRNALVWAGVIKDTTAASQDATQGTGAYDAAVQAATASIRANTNALDKDAKEKLDDKIETAQLADQQKQLESDSLRAANGLLGAGDQALILAQKYGIATDQAQFLINAQQQIGNATALADQRKGEQTGTDLSAAGFNKFANLRRARDNEIADEKKEADKKATAEAKRLADKAAQEAEHLADLRLQNRLIHARDDAAKIAILQEQLAKTTDPIKRQELQNQIDLERLSTAKARTGELNKQLKLEESTYDSIQKQRDAELDIEEATIRGRQAARKAAADDKTAQNILRALGGRTDARALDFRGRAEDVVALDDVERRRREFDLEAKRRTAGGTIINGKLYQSKPSDGSIPAPADSTSASASTTSPAAATGAQGNVLTVNVLVDGKTAWTGMAPFAWDDLMHGVQSVKVSKGA